MTIELIIISLINTLTIKSLNVVHLQLSVMEIPDLSRNITAYFRPEC